MRGPRSLVASLRVFVVAFAALGALAPAPFARAQEPPPARADERPTKTDERRTTALGEAFADVAKKVAGSVVAIRARGDDVGYGVVIEDGGWVLTSRSILEKTPDAQVEVRTGSGEVVRAGVTGRNEAYDVALLKLQGGRKLEPLPRGASGKLAVGQWVVSVGTASERPLAVGVVSALGRRVEAKAEGQAVDLFGLFAENAGPQRAYARVIQHDSPIDADKHGTPLVDAEGRLVGINLANAYRGSAYAAPIDDVAGFIEDLKAGKPGPALTRPGFIGVVVGTIRTQGLAKQLGVTGPGIEIHDVADGLPASKGGLRPGDVVLAIDGAKIQSMQRFGQVIGGTPPGQTIRIKVLRSGEERELAVRVGERPAGDE